MGEETAGSAGGESGGNGAEPPVSEADRCAAHGPVHKRRCVHSRSQHPGMHAAEGAGGVRELWTWKPDLPGTEVRCTEVGVFVVQAEPPIGGPVHRATRLRPPETRQAVTHKFAVGGHRGYLTVGLYPDGSPCEIFLKLGKVGSTLQGFCDAWATAISIMIQHGVPLGDALDKHVGARFEPLGVVEGGGQASSIVDYVARWLLSRYET